MLGALLEQNPILKMWFEGYRIIFFYFLMHFRGKQELDAFTNCIDVVEILKLATHFERMAIGQRGVGSQIRVCHLFLKHVLWSSLRLILYRISQIFRIWTLI